MQIKQESFLDILGIPQTQFVIPVYQRVYSWTARQCEQLWEDVTRAAQTGKSHFTGVLLYTVDPESWGSYGRLRVIDGQQRLTTVTLMLIALAEKLAQDGATVEKFTGVEAGGTAGAEGAAQRLGADDLKVRYLVAGAADDAPCKLMLSHLDRGTLATLVDGGEMPEEHSERLVENLEIFRKRLAETPDGVELLWRGLSRLQVITALLEGDDSPQLVFESLNSKGSPLTAGDLVRNALLFGADEEERRAMYEKRWRPLEQGIAQVEGATMDGMIRAWMAARFREERVRNETDVYAVLKEYLRTSGETIDDMLDDLGRFGAKYTTNPEWRAKADHYAKDWLQDRPRMSVSQFKMFGA